MRYKRSITPWVSNICWRSICAITGSTAVTVVDACAGPAWLVKPESKNPGGIPKVAAELPLCPLFPVCQVPVLRMCFVLGMMVV